MLWYCIHTLISIPLPQNRSIKPIQSSATVSLFPVGFLIVMTRISKVRHSKLAGGKIHINAIFTVSAKPPLSVDLVTWCYATKLKINVSQCFVTVYEVTTAGCSAQGFVFSRRCEWMSSQDNCSFEIKEKPSCWLFCEDDTWQKWK